MAYKEIITGQDEYVGHWVSRETGGTWTPGRGKTIGLVREGELVAGTIYEDFNGANVVMHCAGKGKHWLNREFLWFAFYYPFKQLNCKRVTVIISSTNGNSLRFCQHLGFRTEAILQDAHPDGNLVIMGMRQEECRWLEKKR